MPIYLINLPQDPNTTFNQLPNHDKFLKPGAGVTFIYKASDDYYVLGAWRNNPVLPSTAPTQLSLAIGGKIEQTEEPFIKELQVNISSKTKGHLNIDYPSILSYFACLFVHTQWNMSYLTSIKYTSISNLKELQELVEKINKDIKPFEYGIYKLSDIIKACFNTSSQEENKKEPVSLQEYSSGKMQNVIVFDDIATNFLFQNQFIHFPLPTLPNAIKSKILSHLTPLDLISAGRASKDMKFFTAPETIYLHKLDYDYDINFNQFRYPHFNLNIAQFKQKHTLTNKKIYTIISHIKNLDKLKELIKNDENLIFAVMIILFNDLTKNMSQKFIKHFVVFGRLLSISVLSSNTNIRDKLENEPLFYFILSNFWTIPNAQWLLSENLDKVVREFIDELSTKVPSLLKLRFKNLQDIETFLWEESADNILIKTIKEQITSDMEYFKTLISAPVDLEKIQELFPDINQNLKVAYETVYGSINKLAH